MNHLFLATVTEEEKQRFVAACKGDVARVERSLIRYTEFRENDLSSHQSDLKLSCSDDSGSDGNLFENCFLRFLSMTDQVALDGTRVVYVIPAALNLSRHELSDSEKCAERYEALSVACYFNSVLPRRSMEKLTVLIDVRGGIGNHFTNLKPLSLLNFAKEAIYYLENYFPERMETCVLFPLPASAVFVWKVFRVFIDSDTRKRFKLIKGDSDALADMPIDILGKIVSDESMEELEKRRWEFFDFNGIEGGLEGEAKRRNRKNHQNWIHIVT